MSRRTWEAFAQREPLRDAWRLDLFRRAARSTFVVLGTELLVQEVPEGQVLPDNHGLILPVDMWSAIVDVVDPAPHGAELRRVEQALALEQARVEKLIDNALRNPELG